MGDQVFWEVMIDATCLLIISMGVGYWLTELFGQLYGFVKEVWK